MLHFFIGFKSFERAINMMTKEDKLSFLGSGFVLSSLANGSR